MKELNFAAKVSHVSFSLLLFGGVSERIRPHRPIYVYLRNPNDQGRVRTGFDSCWGNGQL